MQYTAKDVDDFVLNEVDNGWHHFDGWGDGPVEAPFGTIETVESGIQRDDPNPWVTVMVTSSDGTVRYFKVNGRYESWDGVIYDSQCYEVKPVKKTVTFYEWIAE